MKPRPNAITFHMPSPPKTEMDRIDPQEFNRWRQAFEREFTLFVVNLNKLFMAGQSFSAILETDEIPPVSQDHGTLHVKKDKALYLLKSDGTDNLII